MLPKKKRLNRQSFKETFKSSFFLGDTFFSLRLKKDKVGSKTRFAVVVPVSVTKSKPMRNRLKRQIFSILQKLETEILPNHSVIIFFKKEAKNLKFIALESAVNGIFKKAGLFSLKAGK